MKHLILVLIGITVSSSIYCQKVSENFQFEFKGNVLKGKVVYLMDKEPTSTIFIIPGDGRTNFIDTTNYYYGVINEFLNAGLAVCFWDKPGCGNSEGEYDHKETGDVDISALEAIAAIKKLKENNITISNKIGLWGISRAGWICPLVIERCSIDFWISVSGTDDKDNYRYLLESNWLLKGHSKEKTNLLLKEWDYCIKALTKGNINYLDFKNSTQNLYTDSLYNSFGGVLPSETEYKEYLDYYKNSGYKFDSISGLQIMIEDFSSTLEKVNCNVLAIFGKNDSQVDWQSTIRLYQESIGSNQNSALKIEILPNCNHSMSKCDTGEVGEDLSKYNWQPCPDYYNTMIFWLRKEKMIE